MPVTFETPGPFDAGANAAYGAYPIQEQQREAARQRALAQAQLGVQATGQAIQARAAAGGLLQGQQQFEESQRQQREMFAAAQQQQAARDVFAAQQEQAQTALRFQNQAWLQNQELTQAEQINYQRQQNQLGELQRQWNNGNGTLTPQEYNDALFTLRTGLDRDKMRIQKAQADAAKAHAQQMQQQSAHEAAAYGAFQATTVGGSSPIRYEVPDEIKESLAEEVIANYQQAGMPAGLQLDPQLIDKEVMKLAHARNLVRALVFKNPKTGWEPLKPEAKAADKTAKIADQFGRTPADYRKDSTDAEKSADAWVARQEQIDQKKAADNPAFKPRDFHTADPTTGKSPWQVVYDETMRRRGWSGSFADHFGGGGSPGSAGPNQPAGGGQPAPAAEAGQKKAAVVTQQINGIAEDIAKRTDLPAQKKAEAFRAAGELAAIAQKYPVLADAPDDVRRRAWELRNQLDGMKPRPVDPAVRQAIEAPPAYPYPAY